jgi:hypothetical protein
MVGDYHFGYIRMRQYRVHDCKSSTKKKDIRTTISADVGDGENTRVGDYGNVLSSQVSQQYQRKAAPRTILGVTQAVPRSTPAYGVSSDDLAKLGQNDSKYDQRGQRAYE